MAVTNTVQGLNCVIDLLKNILDETKSNSDKTVQPRDVSSTSRTTANINTPEIDVIELKTLNSVNEQTYKSANIYKNVIETITNKDVISGIKNIALLQITGFIKLFNTGVLSLISTFNSISSKLEIDEEKYKKLTSAVESVNKLVKTITNAILSLFGVVIVSAVAGYVAVKAFPFVLAGLGAVTLLIFGIVAIMKLTNMLLKKFKLRPNNNKNLLSTFPAIEVIARTMIALSLLVVISAAAGAIAIAFSMQIFIGFVTLSIMLFVIIRLYNLIDKTSEHSQKAAISIAIIIGSMMLLCGLIFILIPIYNYIKYNVENIILGFIALGVMIIALADILFIVNIITKNIQKNIVSVLLGIGMIILLMVAITGVMFIIVNLAEKINGKETLIWKTLGMMGAILGGTVLTIAIFAGLAMASMPAMVVGIIAVGVVCALLFSLTTLIKSIVDTSIKISDAEKNKVFDNLNSGMVKISSAIALMIKEITAAVNLTDINKFRKIMKPLNELMNVISKFVDILSKIGSDPNFITPVEINEETNRIKNTGNKINIGQVAQNIANSFRIFTDTVIDGFKNIEPKNARNAKRIAKIMKGVMNPISKFANVISKIGSDPNFITEVGEDGKEIGPKVDMSKVSTNIATIFSKFINDLVEKTKNIEIETDFFGRPKIKKLAKLDGVISAISGTLELLTKYKVADDGKSITIIDENGKSKTHIVDFSGIGTILTNLNTNLNGVDTSNIENFSDWAEKDISSSSIWKILNNVEMFDADSTALEKNAANVKIFQEEWTKLDNIMFKDSKNKLKALKEYKETMAELCKVLKEMSESTEKISQMTLPNVNSSSNSSNASVVQPQTNTSTAVDSQNNKAVNNAPQQQPINSSEIADAIKSGLTGSIVKLSFRDSTEDFVADLMLS